MKKILIMTFLTVLVMMSGCGENKKTDDSESMDTFIEEKNVDLESGSDTSAAEFKDENSDEVLKDRKESEMQIKVTDGTNEIIFQLGDDSASESLYEQLPLTLDVENYGSNEKIFYLPEKLDTSDVVEGAGLAGTLAYFSPWGNVVMYYAPFDAYPGLYIMGKAVEGEENIKSLSGKITITAG